MDYSQIDSSPLVQYLFYPRKDFRKPPPGAFDLIVPVDEGVTVSCRGFGSVAEGPWILYFHGNGEVVGDYNGIAPLYHRQGLNLFVADYRGYGESTGKPAFKTLLSDALEIVKAVKPQ